MIDAKKIKKSLSVKQYKEVCDSLGIPIYAETPDTVIYYTGDRHKNPYDGSPKLYYYKKNGVFVSYTSARSYDIFALVQARLSILNGTSSFVDAVDYVLEVTNIKVSPQKKDPNIQVYNWENSLGKYVRVRKYGTQLPFYNDAILNQLGDEKPLEWFEQGISLETMEKYGIGYYEYLNATTIPVYDADGNLVGIRARHWREEEIANGKYRPLMLGNGVIYKFPTNSVLYGLNYNQYTISDTKTVWLVEGEKAVLKLDTWYGNESCAVAMFGKNLGILRRDMLLRLGVKRVVYIPDNDAKGKSEQEYKQWQKEVVQFMRQFKGFVDSAEIVYDNLGLLGAKDNATDGDKETWEKLYENREVIE